MARPSPLYGKDVNAPRALLLWMALSAAAGATNVIAFIACSRFVTHVTGIATTIGLDAADFEHAIDYSLVLLSFIAGACASEFLLGSGPIRKGMGRSLLCVAGILASIALAGRLDAFDAFSQGLEDPRTFVFLGALAFAMGLQNGSIATATGGRVRTTHMTGPATDLGVALARLTSNSKKERVAATQLARLRAIKIAGFILGAALGAVAARFEYLALLLPAAICALVGLVLARATPIASGSKAPRKMDSARPTPLLSDAPPPSSMRQSPM